MRRLAVSMSVLVAGVGGGHAEAAGASPAWQSRPVLDAGSVPVLGTLDPSGHAVLWSAGRTPSRSRWPFAAARPRARTRAVLDGVLADIRANRAGDVLQAVWSDGGIRVAVQAANASMVPFNLKPAAGRELDEAAFAIGEDGTAAVAWTEGTGSSPLLVAVQRPGGRFERWVASDGDSEVRAFDVTVTSNGTVHVAYVSLVAPRWRIFVAQQAPGGSFSAAAEVAQEEANAIWLQSGPLDELRLLATRLTGATIGYWRRSDGSWTPAQRLPAPPDSDLVFGGDGSVAFAYQRASEIRLVRAGPQAPFAAPEQIARIPPDTFVFPLTLTRNTAGEALASWMEEPGSLTCNGKCGHRVRVVAMPSDGRPAGPVTVTPLGTVANAERLVGVIDDFGNAGVAWNTLSTSALTPRQLLTAGGPLAVLSRKHEPTDTAPPRVHADIDDAALRRGGATGTIPYTVTCSEACFARVTISEPHRPVSPQLSGIEREGSVVIQQAGTARGTLQLSSQEQRRLRIRLRLRTARIHVAAVDRAGNAAARNLRPR